MKTIKTLLVLYLIMGGLLSVQADDLSNQYAYYIASEISDKTNGTYEIRNDEDNWTMYLVKLDGTIWEENDAYRRSFISNIMSSYSDVKSTSGWYIDDNDFVTHDYSIVHSPNKFEVEISMSGSLLFVTVNHYKMSAKKRNGTVRKGTSRKGTVRKRK